MENCFHKFGHTNNYYAKIKYCSYSSHVALAVLLAVIMKIIDMSSSTFFVLIAYGLVCTLHLFEPLTYHFIIVMHYNY